MIDPSALLSALTVQAAPLLAAGASQVFVAACCSSSYVGLAPPERSTCSGCGGSLTVQPWDGRDASVLARLAAPSAP